MIAMGVGDEDVRHGLAAHRVEQRVGMRLVVRTGFDDGDAATADDVAHRALVGERRRIVAEDAPDSRRDLLDVFGRQLKRLVEWNVVGHADTPCGGVADIPTMVKMWNTAATRPDLAAFWGEQP